MLSQDEKFVATKNFTFNAKKYVIGDVFDTNDCYRNKMVVLVKGGYIKAVKPVEMSAVEATVETEVDVPVKRKYSRRQK